MLLFPEMQSLRDLNKLLEQMPQLRGFLGDVASFTSLEGYITSSLLVYLPLILAIYAILTAATMITDEITTGTMDFLLEHPVERWRAVTEKYAALLVALVAIGALTGLGLWLGGATVGTSVGFDGWMLAGLNIVPLTLLYGSVAFALACAMRGRGVPVGVTTALAVVGYVLYGLAPLVEDLRRFREWTIYYLFAASKPLSDGINWGYTAILLGASVVCLVVAVTAFSSRDILA
jgi:ABC-2 type transport system permease protein